MPARRFPLSAVAVAACSAAAAAGGSVAVAPCYFQMPAAKAGAESRLVVIQVTPSAVFRTRDGRPAGLDAFRIDAAIAARVIAEFQANKTPPVVDYEHQTLLAEDNGRPAPAAGFFVDMEWREGQGLFATVELTEAAADYWRRGEYRYFSPVFHYDPRTGEIKRVLMGALTNNPAIDGMAPIEARAAARFHLTAPEDSAMNKNLLAVALALAIAVDNQNEDQVGAAVLTKLKELQAAGDVAALRKQLGLKDEAGAEEIGTAIAALKAKADAKTGGEPDPAKYVPVAAVQELRDQVAALSAKNVERDVEALIAPAIEDGRLVAPLESWARDLGKKDLAALKAYLDKATPIAALSGSQTGGQPPAGGKDENGLTAAELAVCSATGVAPKDFAAAKTATA